MTGYRKRPIRIFPAGDRDRDNACLDLIQEIPLSVYLKGNPFAVSMRTPGDELAQAAGMLLAAGVVADRKDVARLSYRPGGIDAVMVDITPERSGTLGHAATLPQNGPPPVPDVPGKSMITDLKQKLPPLPEKDPVDIRAASHCLDRISRFQTRPHGSHTAVIFDSKGAMLSVGEDVGRHNAVDKSIGKLFLADTLHRAAFLVLTCRISTELVQKAARAGLPAIFSVSCPTATAADLAGALGMVIAGRAKAGDLFVFCGAHRLLQQKGGRKERRINTH